MKDGGHHIETEVIKRRYLSGIKNLFNIYLPISDEAMIFDNSEVDHELIAEKTIGVEIDIFNPTKYSQLIKQYEKA